ncbi:pantoate--beta-alanine ligase [Leptospira sp. GIMC2001]|uniref:pantoate--beta-alanine ligase n=1 Tax=Leptospira sp. GIMC2001 TaxID=1513297 RepID=UPI0023496021|nr:pantoate--beta-alanine ligase [Leptospira sp. GIMC2001]WCL48061.1 pantoate--beta-alanine ligase [Leptospira sp. GIMC2001]
MKIVNSSEEILSLSMGYKKLGQKIAFVPTMGFLHAGHISLIEEAKKYADIVVVSIFVNPLQFNNPEDLKTYPVDLEGDTEKCIQANVDILFLPSADTIYPQGIPNLLIQFPRLMDKLCGKTRPGHFEGVLVVVGKLFNLVQPDVAIFGKKDYQQFRIIHQFVEDLSFPIQVIGVDTIREEDGLAMSSRNVKMSDRERNAAELIPRTLKLGGKLIMEGEKNPNTLIEILSDVINSSTLLKIDYLEIVDPISFETKEDLQGDSLIAIAVFAGKVRLIDNIVVQN